MAEWELARREQIDCFYVRGLVVLIARGIKPTPCHRLDFEQRPERILPPMFSLRWRQDGLCAQVQAPYHYAEAFFIGSQPESLRVHHAEGEDVVPVRVADFNTFERLFGSQSPVEAASAPQGAAATTGAPGLTTMAIGEESPTHWQLREQPTTFIVPREEQTTTFIFPTEEQQPTTLWHPAEEMTTLRFGEEGPPTLPGAEDPFGGTGGNPFGGF